jgi:hypothetical protein
MLAAGAACGLAAGAAQAGACSDPWVTQAVTRVLGRPPASSGAPECDIYLYKNGHWSSYNDLLGAVGYYWGTHSYPRPAPAYTSQPSGGYGGLQLAPSASDFRVDSTSLGFPRGVGPAPGRRVVYNGRAYQVANTIAQGGGNVIAQGGGNVIAQGGGNLTVVLRLVSTNGGN